MPVIKTNPFNRSFTDFIARQLMVGKLMVGKLMVGKLWLASPVIMNGAARVGYGECNEKLSYDRNFKTASLTSATATPV
jgi:hypothetical protein